MKPKRFHAEELVELLKRQTIATLPELKKVLGTTANITVFRKLEEISYRTSYSHRGKYYALHEAMTFDKEGLWSFGAVRFSKHGTLLSTVEAFVRRAEAGYFTRELEDVLHVGVKEALLKLCREGRIARERVSGLYLYCSVDQAARRRQIMARRLRESYPGVVRRFARDEVVSDELKAALVLFVSLLDEKQRRLYAGLESLKWGYGGDRKMAEWMGMDVHTVARGRRELLARDVETERIRKAGGGRKPVEKKHRK